MNHKQLITLLVLVLIVGGAGFAIYRRSTSSWEGTTSSSGRVLNAFSLNDVARIVIQTGSTSLALAKNNDTWVIHERDDYPADFARVGNFIQALWQLKPVQEVKAGTSQLGRLELTTPVSGTAGAATLVDLQNKDSKRLAALLAGKKFMKKAAQYPGEEGFPAGRYVMLPGTEPPKVSLVSETLDMIDSNPAAWLDKTFLQVERIGSVALMTGSDPWTLSRENENATDWKLADLKPDEKLDSGKVPAFASILGSPTFIDVLPASARREGLNTVVTVTTFDHFIYTLKFGAPEGDHLQMAVSVSADLPKARTPGKDETPGDRQRLDAEFAATSKRLGENLARAKNLEQRMYLVSNTAFEALLKPRSGLLAPKPAPTPAPSASPVPAPPATASPTPVTVTTPPLSAPAPQGTPGKNPS